MKSRGGFSLVSLFLLAGAAVACGAGDDGAAAPAGVAGRAVSRVDPASAADCPGGGSVVSAGLDDDGNGMLDDAEIESRQVVCRGEEPGEPAPPAPPAPGAPGAPGERALLSRASRVPAGDACPLGGVVMVAGHDDDGDGVLDDAEIETTSSACDLAALTRMRAEPEGENCATGGIAFLTGSDANGDGALADGEVSSIAYECSDVIARDVEIRSAAELALLAGVRVVTGSLVVTDPDHNFDDLDAVDLPALEFVGGSLQIIDNPAALRRLSLPALTKVGGDLWVVENDGLRAIDLPSLKHVTGSLRIEDTQGMSDLGGLAALEDVGSTLRLSGNGDLVEAALPKLTRAGGLAVLRNPLLPSFELRLEAELESLAFRQNDALARVDVTIAPFEACPTCERGIGSLLITENPALVSARVGADWAGTTIVTKNGALDALALEVGRLTSYFDLEGAALRSLTLGPPDWQSGPLTVASLFRVDAPLEAFEVRSNWLSVGGKLELRNTRLGALGVHEALWAKGDVTVENNPNLGRLLIDGLSAGLRVKNNPKLTELGATPALGVLGGNLAVIGSPELTSLSGFGGVKEVTGSVTIEGCDALARPGWPALRRIGSHLAMFTHPGLEAIAFDNLEVIGGLLWLENVGLTAWAGLDKLEQVGGVRIARNDSLTTIGLPALTHASEDIEIFENPSLHTLGLQALASAALVDVSDNGALPACQVEALFAHVAAPQETQSGNDDDGVCP